MRVILHGSQKQNFDTWKGDDNLKIIIYNGNQIVLITKKKKAVKAIQHSFRDIWSVPVSKSKHDESSFHY